jgi:hypothetical protein
MLSPFLKKLLFVRQFLIDKGKIEILGENHVMLPVDLLAELQAIDKEKVHTLVKKHIKTTMEVYSKKMGSTNQGILKSSQDIFETFGLGQFQILKLDNTKKSAVVTISKSAIFDSGNKLKIKEADRCILEASLEGMFHFLFKTEVNVKGKANGKLSKQFIITKR